MVVHELRVRQGHGRLKSIRDYILYVIYHTFIFGWVAKTRWISPDTHMILKEGIMYIETYLIPSIYTNIL